MVDMYKSIVHSCDTYYYMLANDMGIDNIARFMGSLGLGSRTGIDIEGESEGVLPSQEWKKRRFKRPEQQKWYAGETISVGIGQGYNAYTPMQLAQAMATLANDGVMYRPHLVKYITDSKTGEKTMIEPEPLRTRLPWKQQNIEVDQEGDGRRQQGRDRSPRLCRRRVRIGRQDRHGAGLQPERRRIQRPARSRSVCATTPCSSPLRRPTSRRSRSPCWSKTAASAPSRPPRSRAWCSTTTCSASCPKAPAQEDESAVEADE